MLCILFGSLGLLFGFLVYFGYCGLLFGFIFDWFVLLLLLCLLFVSICRLLVYFLVFHYVGGLFVVLFVVAVGFVIGLFGVTFGCWDPGGTLDGVWGLWEVVGGCGRLYGFPYKNSAVFGLFGSSWG